MNRFGGLWIGIVFLGLVFVTGGCRYTGAAREAVQPLLYPHRSAESMSQTSEEHRQMMRTVVRRDRQALIDDLDMLFMTDRPTRLTKWHDQ